MSAEAPEPETPAPPPLSRRRRWLRRSRNVAAVLLILLIIARIVAVQAAPSILDKVARGFGLRCEVGRIDLSLFAGELDVGRIVVTPVEGGEPVLSIGYVRADLRVWPLLRGKIDVRRAEVDDVQVLLDRDADGCFALEKRITAHVGSATTPAAPVAAAPAKEPAKAGSSPSLSIDALRLGRIHVHVRDASVRPALDARLDADLSVRDFVLGPGGTRPAHLALDVSCAPILDALRVEGTATGDPLSAVTAELSCAIERFHPGPLAPYLEPLVRPAAKDVSFTLGLTAHVEGTSAVASLTHVALTADDEESFAVDGLGVTVRAFDEKRIEVERVALDGIRAHVLKTVDGGLRAGGLELRPPRVHKDDEPEETPPETAPVTSSGPAPAIVVDDVTVSNVRASFTDEEAHALLSLVLEQLRVRGIDGLHPDKVATIAARLSAPRVVEKIELDGTALPFAPVASARLSVRASDLTLGALAPYMTRVGIESLLRDGTLGLTVSADAIPGRALEANVALTNLELADKGLSLASIDRIDVTDAKIDPEESRISARAIDVSRPRLGPVGREASGALLACGLRLHPGAAAAAEPPPDPVVAKKTGRKEKPPRFGLGKLTVHGCAASFVDEAVAPVASLVLADAGLELGALEVDTAPSAPAPPPTKLHAWLEAPGILSRLDARGEVVASPHLPSLAMGIVAKGVTAGAVAPYLALAGIESHLTAGELELALHAGARVEPGAPLGASFELEKLRVSDEGRELLGLGGLRVVDAAVSDTKIEVGEVALDRFHTVAAVESGGVVSTLGLRIHPVPAGEKKPAPVTTAATPLVIIKKVRLGEVGLDLHEASQEPAFDLPLRAGLEVGKLSIDLAAKAPLEDAPWKVTASARGALESIVLSGKVALSPKEARVSGTLAATGITLEALAGRLRAGGIEPLLRDGSFGLGFDASATIGEQETTATLHVKGVSYRDGDELAGIDAIDVDGVRVSRGSVAVERVAVTHPRAHAARNASRAIVAGGLSLPPRAAENQPPQPASPPPREGEEASVIRLGEIIVNDVALGWNDASVTPAADASLAVDLAVHDLTLGRENVAPGRLDLSFAAPGLLARGTLAGPVAVEPSGPRALLALDLTGVSLDKVAGYLAPAIRSDLTAGTLHADIAATPSSIALTSVEWADRGASLFHLDALRVRARALGPKEIALEEVALEGVTTRIEKTGQGETRLLGLVLVPQPPRPAAEAPEPAPRKHEKSPLVAIDSLNLNLREVSWRDASQQGSVPLTISNLTIRNEAPICLLGPDPASQPAIQLEVESAVAPIVSRVFAHLRLAPFAQEPDFALGLAIDGIQGGGITRVLPNLAAKLDGSQLESGRVRADASLQLRTTRRDPLDFSFLSKPFGLELILKGVDVRDGEKGPVLAGVDDVHLDVARIDPKSGEVHVRALEVAKPKGLVRQEADGLRVLSILLKKPEPAPDAAPVESAAVAATPAKKKPEVRVDRLTVTDIGFTFEDASSGFPMLVPLTDLDLTVSQFTTRGLTEHRPFHFDLVLRSGKIPLPKRDRELVPGAAALKRLLGEVAEKAHLEKPKPKDIELRRFFEEIAVKGDLALYPQPQGDVAASILALELQNLKGPASNAGVVLDDGVFDFSGKAKLDGHGGVDAKLRLMFTDLEVSDSKEGLLQKVLKLPAPLDAVTYALRDEEGTIDVDLPVPLPPESEGESQEARFRNLAIRFTGVAVEAFAKVCARAVLHSPFRALSTVTGIAGGLTDLIPGADLLKNLEKPKPVVEPSVLKFATGDATLPGAQKDELDKIAKLLRDDEKLVVTLRHAVGGGDLAHARVAANPSPRDRREILSRLEARRADLDRERRASVALERAALLEGKTGSVERSRARDLDVELATVDRALESVYELERDGAERQADRRTRSACMELGAARLERVRAALVERLKGVEDAADRVRVSRPRVEDADGSEGGTVT
ncbi:MAG TPA: DUF748 domain-containing protein, partial [Planctomycetota bacterium]|nr:DUF748 domain-containing protein [Planctomycetota bacterium]